VGDRTTIRYAEGLTGWPIRERSEFVPGNSDPSRIYDDPALADRRGDATGPVAFAFLFLLVAAFAVVALALLSVPLSPDPTARPPGTPGIVATARTSPGPRPTSASTAATNPSLRPSGQPSTTGAPESTGGPAATDGSLPSRQPAPSPTRRTGRPAARGTLGETIPVFLDGRRVGGVVVESFEPGGQVPGVDLPAGARIVVLQVRYQTASGMDYDASDWVLVDADAERHRSLGDRAPAPALGSGRIARGGSVTGTVAFIRERGVTIEQLVLTDGEGRDLVIVDRTRAP
jgi:hypothetical protein